MFAVDWDRHEKTQFMNSAFTPNWYYLCMVSGLLAVGACIPVTVLLVLCDLVLLILPQNKQASERFVQCRI